MLSGHPERFLPRILNLLGSIELPDNLPIPVELDQLNYILVRRAPRAPASHDEAPGKNSVGTGAATAKKLSPLLEHIAVHVDQDRALGMLVDGIAVPRLVGLIDCRPCRIDARKCRKR